jgi:hypothetical protein
MTQRNYGYPTTTTTTMPQVLFLSPPPLIPRILLLLLVVALVVVVTDGERIHPLQTECSTYGCFVDWFCNSETDVCQPCPKQGVGVTEDDCLVLGPVDSLIVQNCILDCTRQQVGDTCSRVQPQGDDPDYDPSISVPPSICEERAAYCDYSVTEEADDESESEYPYQGICQPCKMNVSECATDGLAGYALEECILCDMRYCAPLDFAETQVNNQVISSLPMRGSPSHLVSGTVARCENLIFEENIQCEDERVSDKICLVNDSTKDTYYISVVRKCAALGGIGVIFYGDYSPRTPTNETWRGSLSFQASTIPSVSIPFDDGKRLEDLPGAIVTINVTDNGNACFRQQFCSDDRPCAGSNEGRYCDFKWGNGQVSIHTIYVHVQYVFGNVNAC